MTRTYNSCSHCEHETNDIAGTPCESCVDGSHFTPVKSKLLPWPYFDSLHICNNCVNVNDRGGDTSSPCYYCNADFADHALEAVDKWLPDIDISEKNCATCSKCSQKCTTCEECNEWELSHGCITCDNRRDCTNRLSYDEFHGEMPCWVSSKLTNVKTKCGMLAWPVVCGMCMNEGDDEEDVGSPCYYCTIGEKDTVGCNWLPRVDISIKDCATCTQSPEKCGKCGKCESESYSEWEEGHGCITCANRGTCVNRKPYEECHETMSCWVSPHITENKTDNVNHPSHYISNGLETIDVIEAFCKDLTGMEAVCTANAIKYICRWKHKNGAEDLKKANWYISKLISILEANDNE